MKLSVICNRYSFAYAKAHALCNCCNKISTGGGGGGGGGHIKNIHICDENGLLLSSLFLAHITYQCQRYVTLPTKLCTAINLLRA